MPIFSFIGYLKIDNKFIKNEFDILFIKRCQKTEKKKLLGRHNKDIALKTFAKWLFQAWFPISGYFYSWYASDFRLIYQRFK